MLPNNIIDEIIVGVRERYQTWSDNLPFARTFVDNSANIDMITFNRPIPDSELEPERTETIVDGLSTELINTEMRNFLLELNNHTPTVRHTTTQDNIVETFNTAYNEFFQFRQPDFIIWSMGIQGVFANRATPEEQNKFNELNLRGVIILNQFNDIILGVRQLCGKTYRENRLNIIQTRNIDTRSTDLAFGINQRLDFSEDFDYARISIT